MSHRMCNQFTLHHEFRIDVRKTKLEQKTNDTFHGGFCGQRTQRSTCNRPASIASCFVQAENVEKTSNTVYWVDIKIAQKKEFKFYQTRSNAIIFYASFLYPENYHDGNWRNHMRKNICVPFVLHRNFLQKQVDAKIGFSSCWR